MTLVTAMNFPFIGDRVDTLNLSKCHQSCLLWQTKYFCSDGSAVRNICNKVLDWFKGHCMKHKLELQQRDHTCLLFQGPNFYPCKDWERYCDCETGTIGLLHNYWLVQTSLMTGTVNLGPAVSQVVLLCRTCCVVTRIQLWLSVSSRS